MEVEYNIAAATDKMYMNEPSTSTATNVVDDQAELNKHVNLINFCLSEPIPNSVQIKLALNPHPQDLFSAIEVAGPSSSGIVQEAPTDQVAFLQARAFTPTPNFDILIIPPTLLTPRLCSKQSTC
jgi:hypothetical protein